MPFDRFRGFENPNPRPTQRRRTLLSSDSEDEEENNFQETLRNLRGNSMPNTQANSTSVPRSSVREVIPTRLPAHELPSPEIFARNIARRIPSFLAFIEMIGNDKKSVIT